MGLQIWLPLNGNLNNQGLSDITITNSGATIDNSGKIGQCYNFGSGMQLTASNVTTIPINSWSVACWFYPTASSSGGHQYLVSMNTSSASDFKFSLCFYSDKIGIRTGGTTYSGSTLSLNTWYHGCATYDGTTVKLYLNGECVTTKTSPAAPVEATKFIIGARYNLTGQFVGKINDVRVYDYCLSDKEVEEISKGLVLHYKLDDMYIDTATNLVTSLTAGGQTTVSGGIVTTSGTNADTYFTINLSESIAVGTSYYISCDAEIPEGKQWTFPLGWQGNTGLSFQIFNGHNVYAFTANDGSWGTNRIFMDDGGSPNTAKSCGESTKIFNIKVIKAADTKMIYDSSGYQHNGTITGVLNIVDNSARYDKCIYSDTGVNNRIVTPSLYFNNETVTLNIWFKSSNTAPTGDYHMIVDSNANRQWYEMCMYKGGAFRGGIFVNGTRYAANCTTSTGLNGNWHMLTLVYDKTTVRRYYDGVQESTNTVALSTGLSSPTALTLFRDGPSASYACKETYLSDFRVYATALTADQIKELYNTSASIDNLGNVYARELVE